MAPIQREQRMGSQSRQEATPPASSETGSWSLWPFRWTTVCHICQMPLSDTCKSLVPLGGESPAHQHCYDSVGPELYKSGSGRFGIVAVVLAWSVPLPRWGFVTFLLFFDFVRIAEVCSGVIMEFEVANVILTLACVAWVVAGLLDPGQCPRFGLATCAFFVVVCSFRHVFGFRPEETRMRNVILWHVICIPLFCDTGTCPALICATCQYVFKHLSSVDAMKLLEEPMECAQILEVCKDEETQCCVCLDGEPVYAGAQCNHGAVLCVGCCSRLVKASAGRRFKGCLEGVVVQCPICRLASPVRKC